MRLEIDIETAAGVRVGAGPIATATVWRSKPVLDGAGTFQFTMPAADPAAAWLAMRRVVKCYGVLNGVRLGLGAGLVHSIETRPGDPTMLSVSGPDLLGELATTTVGDLLIRDQRWTALDDATIGTLHWIRYDESDNDYWDGALTACHDDNAGTSAEVTITSRTESYQQDARYLYVGCDMRFDGIHFDIATAPTVDGDSPDDALILQYYCTATGWTILSHTDGTDDGNGPWQQDGNVMFTPPEDWVRYDEAVGSAGNWFWIRIKAAQNAPADPRSIVATIAEVTVHADWPTTGGVGQIMAYAPAGWTTDPSPATTVWEKYLMFEGETVLTALVTLAEQGGQEAGQAVREHFRLRSPTERVLEWLGTTVASTGLVARRVYNSSGLDAAVVRIGSLTKAEDTAELVNTIYPFSADNVSLAGNDRTPPTGYTQGTAWHGGLYVQHTASVAAYGTAEHWGQFTELERQQTDTLNTHETFTANAVFDKAVEYLRTHAMPREAYDVDVLGFGTLVPVGQTIDVVYHEWRDGRHAVNIDTLARGTPLWVTGSEFRATEGGVEAVGLTVATMDEKARTDAAVVVELVRQTRRNTAAQARSSSSSSASAGACDIWTYAETIGNGTAGGTATVFTVTHGLHVRDVMVQVWELDA